MDCILCKSTQVKKIESINNKSLVKLYLKRSNTQVERFFKTENTDLMHCSDCDVIFYSPSAIGDGEFYDELQKYKDYYMDEKSEFSEAAKFIKETDDVLEIGCGKGIFPSYIKYKSYTGLEFSEDAIKQAINKNLNVTNERLENHANYNANKYDIVCFFQVLEHVEHPHSFISDALKCLKPGGKLILAVPSEDSFIKDANNFYLNLPPHHTTKWKDNSLKNIASIFNLNFVHLYHEPLIEAHKLFFIKTKIHKKLCSIFGMKSNNVNLSFFNTLLYSLSVLISIILKPLFNTNKKIGQSVMAVYEKNQ